MFPRRTAAERGTKTDKERSDEQSDYLRAKSTLAKLFGRGSSGYGECDGDDKNW